MSSNKLIFNTIVVISILFISCSPKVQSYRILVFNPEEQVNRYIWDQKRSETYGQNSIHPSIKRGNDGDCLVGPCMENDNASKIKDELSQKEDANSRIEVEPRSNVRQQKIAGLKFPRTYDHNAPRILYWPIFEEEY